METKHLSKSELAAAARKYDRDMNEGGEGYNPYSDALSARIAEESAAWGKWSLEDTIARRAAWREIVNPTTMSGKTMQEMTKCANEAEKTLGFSMAELKAAIQLHNL